MAPLPLALLFGANIGLGALKSAQAAKQRKQEADIRAAEIEASPWTGRAPSTQVSTAAPNPWAEMAGGAINAAGQAAALENAGLFKAGDVASTGTSTVENPAMSTLYSPQQNKSFLNPWDNLLAQQNKSFANPFGK